MEYNFRKNKAKLEEWYICKQLGINHKDWVQITTKKKALANDKLDKFVQLTEVKNKEYINQRDEQSKIDKWYKETSYDDFRELMRKFKVALRDIQEATGWDKTTISTTMSRKIISNNCKCALYYYFNDENNRRFVYSKPEAKPTIKDKEKLNEGITASFKTTLDTDVLASSLNLTPIPSSISFGIKHDGIEKEPVGVSFVKKEDYDRIVKEKVQAEEELARYRYLIDLLRNQ